MRSFSGPYYVFFCIFQIPKKYFETVWFLLIFEVVFCLYEAICFPVSFEWTDTSFLIWTWPSRVPFAPLSLLFVLPVVYLVGDGTESLAGFLRLPFSPSASEWKRVSVSSRLDSSRATVKRGREKGAPSCFLIFFLFSILFFCIEQACRGTGFDIGA